MLILVIYQKYMDVLLAFSPHKKEQIQLQGCFHCTHVVGPDSKISFHASIFVST